MTLSDIPNSSQMSAEVNAPALVTLYDPVGRSVQVLTKDKEYWIRTHGLTEREFNPQDIFDEVESLASDLVGYAEKVIDEAASDGALGVHEDSDVHNMSRTMGRLNEAFNRLQQGLHLAYPNKEPEPIEVQGVKVDPNQVEKVGA